MIQITKNQTPMRILKMMGYHIRLDKADKLCSQWVRLRDRKCMRCNSPVLLNDKGLPISHQTSHFMGRAKEATRFEPLNLTTLCHGCHSYLTAHPIEHVEWMRKRLGSVTVDKLILLSNSYVKKNRELEAKYWAKKLKEDYGIDRLTSAYA